MNLKAELASRFLPPAADYLYERETEGKGIIYPDWPKDNRHARIEWLRDTMSKNRDLWQMLKGGWTGEESLLSRFDESTQITFLTDTADRAVNGLMRSLLFEEYRGEMRSQFGNALNLAYNHSLLSDHNFEHNRRVERHREAMMLSIGELRHNKSMRQWIDSMQLFDSLHDISQLMDLFFNIYPEGVGREQELPAKRGHEMVAALMMLAFADRYAKERGVERHEAWRMCAGAAAITLMHSEPEKFIERIDEGLLVKEDGKDFNKLSGEEIYNLWADNKLDVLKITPAALLKMTSYYRGKYGFVGDKTPWGLLPLFEEEWQEEIVKLSENNRPLVEEIDEEQRQSFYLAVEVCLRSDLLDMISPPSTVVRTFMTQYSKDRPLWRNVNEGDEEANVDEMMIEIVYGAGNVSDPEMDFDLRRMWWELFHQEVINESTIGKSRYMRELIKENVMMKAVVLSQLGVELMRVREKWDVLGKMFTKRRKDVVFKAIRRAKLPLDVQLVYQALYDHYDKETGGLACYGYANVLRDLYGFDTKRLSAKLSKIATEEFGLLEIIKNKPGKGPGLGYSDYDDRDIQMYQRLSVKLIQLLKKRYNVSDKEYDGYLRRVNRGLNPKTMPYYATDSMGSTRPKTLKSFTEGQNQLYEQEVNLASSLSIDMNHAWIEGFIDRELFNNNH